MAYGVMPNAEHSRARVVVIGNEKGGSGKSTTLIHMVASLLKAGQSVACVDLDFRQGSTTRFYEFRAARAATEGKVLAMPEIRRFAPSALGNVAIAMGAELSRFDSFLNAMLPRFDYVVLDTPGNDTMISAHAHSYADVLVTPINDSFIDLDVIARISPDDMSFQRAGHYTELVWRQNEVRNARDGGTIDWVVMRNRLGMLESNNMRSMDRVTEELAERLGFRTIPGFGERVIFRELYPRGLTILDVAAPAGSAKKTMSHVAASQEIRALVKAIGLPKQVKGASNAA